MIKISNSFVIKIQMNSNVKRWVLLDSQLKIIQEKTKKMREEKNMLGSNICQHLENSGNAHRKIMIHDGDLKIYEKKDYSPLTFAFLEKHLGKIMTDPNQVEFVIQYLKDQREIKTTNDLKRSYKNVD
jgi:hypothetical protein